MTALGIILLIVSVILIVLVVLQEGKNNRLSGAIAGGNSDTFLGKSKAASNQAKLAKGTVVAASVFAALVLAMYIVGISGTKIEYQEPAVDTGVSDVVDTSDTTAADTTEGEDASSDDVVSE